MALLELIVALRYGGHRLHDWCLVVTLSACVFFCVCLCLCCNSILPYLCRSWSANALAILGNSSKAFFLRKSWATASIKPTSTWVCSRSEKHRPSTSTSCSDRLQSSPSSRLLCGEKIIHKNWWQMNYPTSHNPLRLFSHLQFTYSGPNQLMSL